MINSVLKIVTGIVKLRGGTDNTVVGNISDSLRVVLPTNQLPVRAVHESAYLKASGSEAMNVNGSVTPVNFDFVVPSGQTIFLDKMTIFIQDQGSMDSTDFGSIAGPFTAANVLIQYQSIGSSYTFASLRDNIDIVNAFRDFGLFIDVNGGMLNDNDLYTALKIFSPPVTLQNSTSDFVRARVEGNLTGLTMMKAYIEYWRLV